MIPRGSRWKSGFLRLRRLISRAPSGPATRLPLPEASCPPGAGNARWKGLRHGWLRPPSGAGRLVCFGDNINDLPMFAVADASYATANANRAVRAAASGVIGASDDDAVVHRITALHGAPRVASAGERPAVEAISLSSQQARR